MSCYHPIKAFRTPDGVVFDEKSRHDIIGDIELPCGRCIGCRMRRATDWTLRCMHEAQCHSFNCFVTLTYARDRLPPDGSLDHGDFQKFMKRVRWKFGVPVRFYMCGEYGPVNLRPHYHACLFGVDFRSDRTLIGDSKGGMPMYSSALLDSLWTHGRSTVQDLVKETAGYCARYIMKKQLGRNAMQYVSPDGVILRPEYAAMSLKPGIGAEWFNKYHRDVYPHDFAIADGVKLPAPKYYDKLIRKLWKDGRIDEIEYKRYLSARASPAENSEERRIVREIVHNARVATLTRGDVDDEAGSDGGF